MVMSLHPGTDELHPPADEARNHADELQNRGDQVSSTRRRASSPRGSMFMASPTNERRALTRDDTDGTSFIPKLTSFVSART